MSLKKDLPVIILIGLLIGFLGGCVSTKPVILKDSEQITRHPADPNKVCLDEGYLLEIFEQLGK